MKREKREGERGKMEREEGRGTQADLLYCILNKNKKNKSGLREVFLHLCSQNHYSSHEMEANPGVF